MKISKNSVFKTGLITIVTGLVLGASSMIAFSQSATGQGTNAPSPAMGQNAVEELRLMLNAADREHTNLIIPTGREAYDDFGSRHFQGSAHSLDINSNGIADAIGSLYGAEARGKFLQIWRDHIDELNEYAVAKKNNDQEGMNRAKADLDRYTNNIADLLSTANPNLPREAVKQLFIDHVSFLLRAVDQHAAGQTEESFATQHDADMQAGEISDALSTAIVKQFPNKF